MKIKYQAPKGQRLNKQFATLDIDDELRFKLWYYPNLNQWLEPSETLPFDHQSYCDCHSLKAAIRKISKWDVPKGTTFRLCSRFIGCDIYITKGE